MKSEVVLNAVGCEEHFAVAGEYQEEAVEGLQKNKRKT